LIVILAKAGIQRNLLNSSLHPESIFLFIVILAKAEIQGNCLNYYPQLDYKSGSAIKSGWTFICSATHIQLPASFVPANSFLDY